MSFLQEAKIIPAPDRMPPDPLAGVTLREAREKARTEDRLLTEKEMANFRQAKPGLHWEEKVEKWGGVEGVEIKVLSVHVFGPEERKIKRLKNLFEGIARYRFVFCSECQGWTETPLEPPYDDGQCHYLVCGVCQTTLAQKRYRFID